MNKNNSFIFEQMGVDVDRSWQLFDNDVLLVDGSNNLYQAIYNRLMTSLNDMDYFYDEYGSNMRDWLGELMSYENLQNLADEVHNRVLEDPRISDCDVTCVPYKKYNVIINIVAITYADETFEYNFVLDKLANELDTVTTEPTQMNITLNKEFRKDENGYYCVKRGDTFTINTFVYDQHGCGVPIGNVFYSCRGNSILKENTEISYGNSSIDYKFPVATQTHKYTDGIYRIYVYYKGVGRFSSCQGYIDINVVERYPTITKYRQSGLSGYRGQLASFPTSVTDINDGKVNVGTVDYSIGFGDSVDVCTDETILLSAYHQIGSKLTANNMYTDSPRHALFSHATLTDVFGDAISNAIINFYIANGDGFNLATKTVLGNSFIDTANPLNPSFYHARVTDMNGKPAHGGNVKFSYRKHELLDTTTILPNPTKLYHGADNVLTSDIIDEDNLNVLEGRVDYYIRQCTRCKPYDSFTHTRNVYFKDGKIFTKSDITDEDDIPIKQGSVTYDYSEVPISLKTDDTSFIKNGAKKSIGAMIVDNDGVVIDAGKITTQKVNNNYVTSYVSQNDDVDENDEDTIKFEVVGDNINGKKEDRNK